MLKIFKLFILGEKELKKTIKGVEERTTQQVREKRAYEISQMKKQYEDELKQASIKNIELSQTIETYQDKFNGQNKLIAEQRSKINRYEKALEKKNNVAIAKQRKWLYSEFGEKEGKS